MQPPRWCWCFWPARPSASPELARDSHCLNCHALDHKRVGPALRDVAVRYAWVLSLK